MAHRRTYIGTLTFCTAQQFRGKDTFRTKNCPCLVPNEEKRPHTELTFLLRSHFIDGAFQHCLNCGDDFLPQFSWKRYYLVKLITH